MKGRMLIMSAAALLLVAPGVFNVTSTSTAAASVIDSTSYGGHEYYLLTNSTWEDAQAFAVTLGGNLATINDEMENDFLYRRFAFLNYDATNNTGGINLWIGLNDVATENDFVWASGDTATYRRWAIGEPNNNLGGGESFVAIWGPSAGGSDPSFWNDFSTLTLDRMPLYGVVEVVPEPAILVLLGLGFAGLGTSRTVFNRCAEESRSGTHTVAQLRQR